MTWYHLFHASFRVKLIPLFESRQCLRNITPPYPQEARAGMRINEATISQSGWSITLRVD
jgi:hypothetical protein